MIRSSPSFPTKWYVRMLQCVSSDYGNFVEIVVVIICSYCSLREIKQILSQSKSLLRLTAQVFLTFIFWTLLPVLPLNVCCVEPIPSPTGRKVVHTDWVVRYPPPPHQKKYVSKKVVVKPM